MTWISGNDDDSDCVMINLAHVARFKWTNAGSRWIALSATQAILGFVEDLPDFLEEQIFEEDKAARIAQAARDRAKARPKAQGRDD